MKTYVKNVSRRKGRKMRKEIILYHGNKKIVEYPEIRVTKYNKDFYFGFYCTTLDAQAKRWATRFDGKISREAFGDLARFKKSTHQISFHTAKSLTALKFLHRSALPPTDFVKHFY